MKEYEDCLACCLICGETMNYPTIKQMKIFGSPECCEEEMVPVSKKKLHAVVRGLDKLRANIEESLLEGTGMV